METPAIRKKRTKRSNHQLNKQLRYYRKMRHWTQANLADELYKLCEQDPEFGRGIINANMIGGWERGEHMPSLFWQRKLCEVFGATADALGFVSGQQEAFSKELQSRVSLSRSASESFEHTTSPASYQKLAAYLQQQQDRHTYMLASGSRSLRVRDVIYDSNLFIPPVWKDEGGSIVPEDLIEYIVEVVREQKHLLLLGEAGHGKTIILKYVFSRLVGDFLQSSSGSSFLVPLYIPLREFSSLSGQPADVIWSHIGEDFPLPYEEFEMLLKARRILLLLDGFDEIKGELTQRLINERVASKVFNYAALLSCRKSFFDSYLATAPLKEMFHHLVELQPASINTNVIQYIRSVCKRQQTPVSDVIINAIQMSKELQELAQRPLLLLMILEIFTSARDIHEERWSATRLYRKYTEHWLKHEAAKPDSVLKWSEKSTLLQEMAWFTYRGSFSHRLSHQAAFTHEELYAFVRTVISRFPDISESQLLDDLCFRSILEISEEENYTFVHKSIQEYYVARYIFECMRSQETQVVVNIEQAFQMNHPFEIASFLRELLKDATFYEKGCITENLIQVYERNKISTHSGWRMTVVRQHASHYLTSLSTEQAIQFLEGTWKSEPDKWVQRSILIGLALYSGRVRMLDQYIQMIREDSEAASINIGYHLVYYGDMAQPHASTSYASYQVDQCEKTVKALFRHLQDDHYRNGWSLDLLTLLTLIEMKGTSILQASSWYLPFLKGFLQQDHHEMVEVFLQEKNAMKHLLHEKGELN